MIEVKSSKLAKTGKVRFNLNGSNQSVKVVSDGPLEATGLPPGLVFEEVKAEDDSSKSPREYKIRGKASKVGTYLVELSGDKDKVCIQICVASPLAIKIQLSTKNDEDYKRVMSDIRRVRAVKSKMLELVYMSEVASAKIKDDGDSVSLLPDTKEAIKVLSTCLGSAPKDSGNFYHLRTLVRDHLPTFLSAVCDDVRCDIRSKWLAKDQVINAKRNFLAANHKRRIPRFMGSGMNLNSNTKPKISKKGVTLKWSNVGEVEFRIVGKKRKNGSKSLDPHIYHVLSKISSGQWEFGTLTLNERDGKLYLQIPYYPEVEGKTPDKDRTLAVSFDDSDERNFMVLSVLSPSSKTDVVRKVSLSAKAVLSRLRSLSILSEKRSSQADCGGRMRKKFLDLRSKVTDNRRNFCLTQNHEWSKKIVSTAESWGCGRIVFFSPEGDLFGHPWAWKELEGQVKYKCSKGGANILFEARETVRVETVSEEVLA